MTKFAKRMNYRKQYPDLSDEIIEVLEKSDRKMEYQQYDLKVERYWIDYTKRTVAFIPSREDSYEWLLDENRQFAAECESVENAAVKKVMLEKMRICLELLTSDERELITELFFKDKSERQVSKETGIPYMTIHDRKVKILGKLRKHIINYCFHE